ncbi:MAG: FAD-dependent oxidoreductase, partial [Candidatus Eremiobacteraeota bacterium]|nr:FAD-dependent oxidoreductase [Candidatus Eremiobacteraeota bacterium]
MEADVIVIGAGAAGLAAARRLAMQSRSTIVLEARNRVGGRVWSHPTARAATPAELGAEFIHGGAPQTMALLREAGGAALDSAGETWVSKDGRLTRDDTDFCSAAQVFADAASLLPEDESVDAFLRRLASNESLRAKTWAARAFVEGFDAADPRVASVRAIAQEWGAGLNFPSSRPLGGYGPLFDFIRADCETAGVVIELNTIARRVIWQRQSVTVETIDGSGRSQTRTARAVVITLPAGVLRRRDDTGAVSFEPALPAEKQNALASIEMGHVAKIVLQFRTPFWEEIARGRYRDGAFFRCDGPPFPTYWTLLPTRSELVVAWAGGPKATALEHVAHHDLVELACAGFGALFAEPSITREEFDRAFSHDWS